MSRNSVRELMPRNRHTLVVGVVARISGCQNQKEMSLDDQIDHAKEEVIELYKGFVEYRIIATIGKGESLDRPELVDIERMVRTRELDLLIMEDVGRLVRGAEAVRLWGIAVDHGTRCLAPNDCLDTADESWEEDLLAACRDHVGHNAHTSKRLKKKLMNRFKKFGGAAALPISGYVKPDGAASYEDWHKDDAATPIIVEGLKLLKATLNGAVVGDFFNSAKFATGPYCKNKEWEGPATLRFFRNTLLSGRPCRGYRHTVKHNETGRRVSVKNVECEPAIYECPHLAHIDPVEQDELIRMLAVKNANIGRETINGVDPLFQRSKKRTKFPGQYARCWYCGRHFVWGGNGVTKNLMCTGARHWRCWNSIGFDGHLAAERIVAALTAEMHRLDRFDVQFAEMIRMTQQRTSNAPADRWRKLLADEADFDRHRKNVLAAIVEYGTRPMLHDELNALEAKEAELKKERRYLESLQGRELALPESVAEMRELLLEEFVGATLESPEFGTLLQQLVPEFHVYLVRLCDGGHLLPRARVKLDLTGHIEDAQFVPELNETFCKVVTIDLFEKPPQRERIRCDAVNMAAAGMTQRAISRSLKDESPKLPVVQEALALDRQLREKQMTSPYVVVSEPPSDYRKLRRHRNPKYRFEPLEEYQRPPLTD